MKPSWIITAIVLLSPLSSTMALANTRVRVSVQRKSWYKANPAPAGNNADGPAESKAAQPPVARPPQPPVDRPLPKGTVPALEAARNNVHEIDPTTYLRRMLEYEITHEPGFAAVDSGCTHTITVELYQLQSGWTVFARYSGTEREEKIDHAEIDEFAELAQRIAFALLRNRSITHTITRENVLRADSEINLRTINGTGHLLFGMGTEVRLARLATAQGAGLAASPETRLLTPVSIQIGYRRKLRAWGLDAFGRVNLGTESTGIHRNDLGGHVDYNGSGLVGLHFLHYLDAPGVTSLYFGGGAAFELAFFNVIRPAAAAGFGDRDGLLGGGLNIELLVGYEFLRASSVHFFGQMEAHAPAYAIKSENDSGAINTYMPGVLAQIGVIF
ncbi:MAG TPA: hypothetical protein VFH68_07000 [Polyangia bacterium]|jgi:hypothetical protein|nr:hypothetical protein [Polyangia bacterium]